MIGQTHGSRMVADVKCYHCGHISGQIVGYRGEQFKASDFMPRPGYRGELPGPGARLRCERCKGPVFLEDVTSSMVGDAAFERALRERSSAA